MAEKREKVVVAMSGGVDSSVAACLLVEQGYDVMGLFMRTGVTEPETPQRPTGKSVPQRHRAHQGCCSASDAADARFIAGMLGIPFYALNFEQDFDRLINYFADEYARGRTPNPCVVCNDRLKFGRIVEYADAVGARYVATGHYARIGQHDGRNVLMRGLDEKKDQSYVLFGLSRAILDRVLFPVGELTKRDVRRIAEQFNLPNRDKPDSVEICFVPDRDYARVVCERRPDVFAEGDVLDQTGRVVGRHKGIPHFTVGQRRGLGIAAGKPIYVTQLDIEKNTITVGDGDALLSASLIADRANFLVDVPDGPFHAKVKIRYLHKAAPATVEILPCGEETEPSRTNRTKPTGTPVGAGSGSGQNSTAMNGTNRKIRVVFDEPQRAVTPGQAVVFYNGDIVLGGAWIEQALRGMTASSRPCVVQRHVRSKQRAATTIG